MKVNQPFELEGVKNLRELGGYVNSKKQMIQKHRFLRSSSLSHLTSHDCEFLYDYGVRTVIDLRSENEVIENPDKLLNYRDVEIVNISLLSKADSTIMMCDVPKCLSDMYVDMIERNKANLYRIFKVILDAKGTILFHCTAGKDRTGVVAMLILKLAGIDNELIIKDYTASGEYLADSIRKLKETLQTRGFKIIDSIFESKAEDMENTLKYFDEHYTIDSYFKSLGFSKDLIKRLMDRCFLEDYEN